MHAGSLVLMKLACQNATTVSQDLCPTRVPPVVPHQVAAAIYTLWQNSYFALPDCQIS